MSESIEFHDSTLTSVSFQGASVEIELRAYVHRWERVEGTLMGTGWVRPVRIVLSEGAGGNPPQLPLELYGGQLRTGEVTHDNLVPLPFDSSESTHLELEIPGGVLAFTGRSVTVEPVGDATYIEDLPEEFAAWNLE